MSPQSSQRNSDTRKVSRASRHPKVRGLSVARVEDNMPARLRRNANVMEDLWKPAVALGGAAIVGAWLVMAWASRRRKRLAVLGPVAAELGLAFHGDSFRGRLLGHAVRGDAVGEIPGRDYGERSALLAPFSFGESVVRVRVELTSPGEPPPWGPKALAAVRREFKDSGAGRGACEAALHGTEIVFLLRGDAVDVQLARRAVEKAIEAAGPE